MRAAVLGGAGYAGGELLRLLHGHPEIAVTQATSERLAGRRIDSVHPPLRGRTDMVFTPRDQLESCDIVFCALKHGETSAAVEQLRTLAPVL
ncbi:MAG: N-acetyl-gamma-glutamyl-phosphate reductase, partial [Candidatus Dormibacteraeota bacterium]|nr:N-acetyl-gamma-glutamyl-phosphate reductase [Candidatus Dormibacteraeota bacterium]